MWMDEVATPSAQRNFYRYDERTGTGSTDRRRDFATPEPPSGLTCR
jgi:hypothetical protein